MGRHWSTFDIRVWVRCVTVAFVHKQGSQVSNQAWQSLILHHDKMTGFFDHDNSTYRIE